jgi:protein tyrosine/serine phosphatase
MNDRVLVFEGIHNFRDYGGYAARAGRLVRGRLWRSGQHAGATPADLARVHECNIATVIDLRGDSERAAYPCLRHADFKGEVLFCPGETGSTRGRAVHEEHTTRIHTPDDARAVMTNLYRNLPFRDVLVGSWRLYAAALAAHDGASLLHCLAGKDRTGMGVAVVHHLLGVHGDDIMDDYLLTNHAGDVEARIAAQSQSLSSRGMSDAVMRVILGAEPEYLDAGFAAIRERHGSVEAYAETVWNIGAAEIAAMERHVIA